MLQHRELQHLCVGLALLPVTLYKVCRKFSDVAGNVLKKHQNANKPNKEPPKISSQENAEDSVFCISSFVPEHWLPALPGISPHHSSAFPKDYTMRLSIQCTCSCEFHSEGQRTKKSLFSVVTCYYRQ